MYAYERRKRPRSSLHSKGLALVGGRRFGFRTLDVSIGGSLVEFEGQPEIEQGAGIDLSLDIGFIARARVCRVSRNVKGLLTAGLIFERLDFSRKAAYPLH